MAQRESYRQEEVRRCREAENLVLKREPHNKYDPNAVAVLRQNGKQIGYLSRDDAEWAARIMDDGDEVKARIKWITGGKPDKPSYGVVIDINTTPSLGWEESNGMERESKERAVSGMVSNEEKAKKSEAKVEEKRTQKGFWKRMFGG